MLTPSAPTPPPVERFKIKPAAPPAAAGFFVFPPLDVSPVGSSSPLPSPRVDALVAFGEGDKMVVAEIATGYSALKSAYEIARGLKDINDRVALNAAVIDLQEKILSAQEAAASAKDRLRELQDTIAAFENWDTVAARYRLKDFGEGTFAYELAPDDATGEPAHLICSNCFQQRKRAILQYSHTGSGRKHFDCQACGKRVGLGTYVAYRPPVNRSGDF